MDTRYTTMTLPVLIGEDYEHVMAHATIVQTLDKTTITIEGEGPEARHLASFVTSSEPVALAFVAIPIKNKNE